MNPSLRGVWLAALLAVAAVPGRGETPLRGDDPLSPVKAAFIEGKKVHPADEAALEGQDVEIFQLVKDASEGCRLPCRSKEEVARYRKALALIGKVLELDQKDSEKVQAVYCPGPPHGCPCRLRGASCDGSVLAGVGLPARFPAAAGAATGPLSDDVLERVISRFGREAEALKSGKADGLAVGIDLAGWVTLNGRFPEIGAQLDKDARLAALVRKPLLEVTPDEWGEIEGRVKALGLGDKAQRLLWHKAQSEAVHRALDKFEKSGRREDLQSALKSLNALLAGGLAPAALPAARAAAPAPAAPEFYQSHYQYFDAVAKLDEYKKAPFTHGGATWRALFEALDKNGYRADFEAGVAGCSALKASPPAGAAPDRALLNFDNVDAPTRSAVFQCAMHQVIGRSDRRALEAEQASGKAFSAADQKRLDELSAAFPEAAAPQAGTALAPGRLPGASQEKKKPLPASLERQDLVRRLSAATLAAVVDATPPIAPGLRYRALAALYRNREIDARLGRAAAAASLLGVLAERFPDTAFARKAEPLLREWQALAESRDPEKLHAWAARADLLLGQSKEVAAGFQALCEKADDPGHQACLDYAGAAVSAQRFFRERLESKTAPAGTVFHADDLGIADKSVKSLVVAGVERLDGRGTLAGLRTVSDQGTAFVSYDGALSHRAGQVPFPSPTGPSPEARHLSELGLPFHLGALEETVSYAGGRPAARRLVIKDRGRTVLDVKDEYDKRGALAVRDLTDAADGQRTIDRTDAQGRRTLVVENLPGPKDGETWSRQEGVVYPGLGGAAPQFKLSRITDRRGLAWDVAEDGVLSRPLADTGGVVFGNEKFEAAAITVDLSASKGEGMGRQKAVALAAAITKAMGWSDGKTVPLANWLSDSRLNEIKDLSKSYDALDKRYCVDQTQERRLAVLNSCGARFSECKALLGWARGKANTAMRFADWGGDAKAVEQLTFSIAKDCKLPSRNIGSVAFVLNLAAAPAPVMGIVYKRPDGTVLETQEAEFGAGTPIAAGGKPAESLIAYQAVYEYLLDSQDSRNEKDSAKQLRNLLPMVKRLKYRAHKDEYLFNGEKNSVENVWDTDEAGAIKPGATRVHHYLFSYRRNEQGLWEYAHGSRKLNTEEFSARESELQSAVGVIGKGFSDLPVLGRAIHWTGGVARNAYHATISGYRSIEGQRCAALSSAANVEGGRGAFNRDTVYRRLEDDPECLDEVDALVRERRREELRGVIRPADAAAFVGGAVGKEERLGGGGIAHLYSGGRAIEVGVKEGGVAGAALTGLGVLEGAGDIAVNNLALFAPMAAVKWVGGVGRLGGLSADAQGAVGRLAAAGELTAAERAALFVDHPAYAATSLTGAAFHVSMQGGLVFGGAGGVIKLVDAGVKGDWTTLAKSLPNLVHGLFMGKGLHDKLSDPSYQMSQAKKAAQKAIDQGTVARGTAEHAALEAIAAGGRIPEGQGFSDLLRLRYGADPLRFIDEVAGKKLALSEIPLEGGKAKQIGVAAPEKGSAPRTAGAGAPGALALNTASRPGAEGERAQAGRPRSLVTRALELVGLGKPAPEIYFFDLRDPGMRLIFERMRVFNEGRPGWAFRRFPGNDLATVAVFPRNRGALESRLKSDGVVTLTRENFFERGRTREAETALKESLTPEAIDEWAERIAPQEVPEDQGIVRQASSELLTDAGLRQYDFDAQQSANRREVQAAIAAERSRGRIADAGFNGRQGEANNCLCHAMANMIDHPQLGVEVINDLARKLGKDPIKDGLSSTDLVPLLEAVEAYARARGIVLRFDGVPVEKFFEYAERASREGRPRPAGLAAIRTSIDEGHAVVVIGQVEVGREAHVVTRDSRGNLERAHPHQAFAEILDSNYIIVVEKVRSGELEGKEAANPKLPNEPKVIAPESHRIGAKSPRPEPLPGQDEALAKFALKEKFSPGSMTQLPGGVKPELRTALEAIRSLFRNKTRFFGLMQQLEAEVAKRAQKTGEAPEVALEHVLSAWEAEHGFKPAITLRKPLSDEKFLETIAEGALFRDEAFPPDKDFYTNDKKRQGHGVQTHRLQWNVVMRAMKADKAAFGGVENAAELYKYLGEVGDTLGLEGTGANQFYRDLWFHLFDADFRVEPNWSSPEYLKKHHAYWPGLGEWR